MISRIRPHRQSKRVIAMLCASGVMTGLSTSILAAPRDADASVTPTAPTQYKNTTAKSRKQTAAIAIATQPDAAWWTLFHDRTLADLEEAAILANQDLRQGVARVIEARQEAISAAADFYPHLDATLRGSRQRITNTGPLQHGRFTGAAISSAATSSSNPAAAALNPLSEFFTRAITTQPLTATYNDFRTPLTLTYELDVFGRIRGTYDQARANAQAQEADRRTVQLSLTSQVATNYFSLRALDAEVAILQKTIALREESVHLQRQRFDLGAGSALDVSRARVELDNAQSDLTDTLRLRAETENSLALLCGQAASNFHLPPRPLDGSHPPAIPAGVPAQLVAQRPDLIESERKVAAAANGIRVARAELLPSFNLEGDAGYDSAHAGDVFEWQSRTWELMATVKIPIFEGGRNLANLRAAKARREEAIAAYQQTALTAFKEVENALADLHQRAAQAGTRERAVADSQQVLEFSKERYDQGAVTYFEVIDAQRGLLSAQLGRIETLNARYAATVELIRALGGPYEAR